ncbi:hypothetical protein D3C80_1786660 [compost metagenome]
MDITAITMALDPEDQLLVNVCGGNGFTGGMEDLSQIITTVSTIDHFFNSGQEVSLLEFRMVLVGKAIMRLTQQTRDTHHERHHAVESADCSARDGGYRRC